MLPENKGSYKAQPIKWRVGESKKGAVELAVELNLYEWWNGEAWVPCNNDIQGYFYLITKEGKVNEGCVESVEDAFGWDRRTGTAGLANRDSLPNCQVFCDYEMYNGAQKMKVKWLNNIDREPSSGIGDTDPQEVASIDAKYGQAFRATARKVAPPRPAAPAANGNGAAKPVAPADAAKRIAWDKFKASMPMGSSNEVIANDWRTAVANFLPGKDQSLWSVQDWQKFVADDFHAMQAVGPIGDAPQFTPDEIPF